MSRLFHTSFWFQLAGAAALSCFVGFVSADELDLSDLLGDEPEPEASKFVAHEWGSVNLVQDSDRALISGLVDDQSDLPPFVNVWTENQGSQFPMIIEKPILYFYSKEAVFANVRVRCPEGILTQWWPNATKVTPVMPTDGDNQKMPELKNGILEWNWVAVSPNVAKPDFKQVGKHPWWGIARETDSAVVRVKGGEEKFLFYRGAARLQSTLHVNIDVDTEVGHTFSLDPVTPEKAVRHVFTMNVPEEGAPQIGYTEQVAEAGAKAKTLDSVDAAVAILRQVLLDEGLYEKEADGMIKIWRKGMFETPGLRAMYLMERKTLDAFLPLTIQPAPDEIERVMLVRIDCLTPDREERILELLKQLGAENFRERGAAQKKLMEIGRVGQAVMRKFYEDTEDPEIRMRLKAVLKQISPRRPR